MTKKDKLIKQIKKQTFLPLYIRNAEIDVLKDEANMFFNVLSNKNSYQTIKHHHTILYKPIILLDEKV